VVRITSIENSRFGDPSSATQFPDTPNQHPNRQDFPMNEQTLDQLRSLRLDDMVRAIEEKAPAPRLLNWVLMNDFPYWCKAKSPGAMTNG
jgi:predicted metal-dependent phosphoesterase TrpH